MAYEAHELGLKLLADYRDLVVCLLAVGDEPECIEVSPWELDAMRTALSDKPGKVFVLGVPVILNWSGAQFKFNVPQAETWTRVFKFTQEMKEHGIIECVQIARGHLDSEFGQGAYAVVEMNEEQNHDYGHTFDLVVQGYSIPESLLPPSIKSISFDGELLPKLQIYSTPKLQPGFTDGTHAFKITNTK